MIERPEFEPFGKIYRWNREWIITEKIDGTNAQILITEDGQAFAGSRKRWITPQDDNFGFAAWVEKNKGMLVDLLGPGRHFGEWWGKGIQRGYGCDGRYFSLFNVSRWRELPCLAGAGDVLVVPELSVFMGTDVSEGIETILEGLQINGSAASIGFMNPEGIVALHVPSGALFKRTLKQDEEYKGKA